jgi:hypothetical protein
MSEDKSNALKELEEIMQRVKISPTKTPHIPKANRAYYNEDYGKFMADIVQKLKDRPSKSIRIAAKNLSINTLRSMCYASLLWVKNNCPELLATANQVRFEKYLNAYRARLDTTAQLITAEITNWRTDFEDFLMEAQPGQVFEYRCPMSPEELQLANAIVRTFLHDFVFVANEEGIVCVKRTPDMPREGVKRSS